MPIRYLFDLYLNMYIGGTTSKIRPQDCDHCGRRLLGKQLYGLVFLQCIAQSAAAVQVMVYTSVVFHIVQENRESYIHSSVSHQGRDYEPLFACSSQTYSASSIHISLFIRPFILRTFTSVLNIWTQSDQFTYAEVYRSPRSHPHSVYKIVPSSEEH